MHRLRPIALSVLFFLAACSAGTEPASAGDATDTTRAAGIPPAAVEGSKEVAVFAGGCFWCVESAFDVLPGVESAVSGYTGGPERNPSYKAVSSGRTGHTEAVRVLYDPKAVTYSELLEVFWHNIDPFQAAGQFCDRGSQYRSGIFPVGPEQQALAEASRKQVQARFADRKVVTEVTPGDTFWPAEEYHQDFHIKNSVRYQSYRWGCGRDRRLEEIWGRSKKH